MTAAGCDDTRATASTHRDQCPHRCGAIVSTASAFRRTIIPDPVARCIEDTALDQLV